MPHEGIYLHGNENTRVQPGQDLDLVNENQVVDLRGIRYDGHEGSRLRAEPLSSGAGGEVPGPVRNLWPCSRGFRVPSEKRPPAFAFRNRAADEAWRQCARATGMLQVPGFQARREAGPSTCIPARVRCLPAVPT